MQTGVKLGYHRNSCDKSLPQQKGFVLVALSNPIKMLSLLCSYLRVRMCICDYLSSWALYTVSLSPVICRLWALSQVWPVMINGDKNPIFCVSETVCPCQSCLPHPSEEIQMPSCCSIDQENGKTGI